ncbi:MAG: hypothetical protein M1820_006364 [Bogoriella megaspora]|nr:MAG: hypothetical protein M1820_006364 [Bogoriella megaspora]
MQRTDSTAEAITSVSPDPVGLSIGQRPVWKRKAHQKTKDGCTSCKKRHQKCDENRPKCWACTGYSTECDLGQRSQKPTSQQSLPAASVPDAPMLSSKIKGLEDKSTGLNLCDLELLHQYLIATCMSTNQKPEVTSRIQITMPALALQYTFLMHGILSMAAVHLARIRPARQEEYLLIASRYQNLALPAYRSAVQHLDARNCHALVAFSKGILWSAFAYPPCIVSPGFAIDVDEDGDWLPNWFHLLYGSCMLVKAARGWIEAGPHPHLVNLLIAPLEPAVDSDTQHILDFVAHLNMISGDVGETESLTIEIETDAALRLCNSFAIAAMSDQNTPLRNAVNAWIESLPPAYLTMLQNKNPRSLVILAFFCVLIQRSETVWYMQGNAKRLLLVIEQNLDSSYMPWIHWPRSLILEEIL